MKSAAVPRAPEALCTTALKGRGKQRNSEGLPPRVVYAVSCYVHIQLATARSHTHQEAGKAI